MASARCDPPRNLARTWSESTFQFYVSRYTWSCLEAPFAHRYPLAYREVLTGLNPPTRGSSLSRLLSCRKRWWGGGCRCSPEPLLAGRHGPGRLPWGGAGRGSKKGTWAGQPASSRLCSAPEHVGWAGHGKNRSSSRGAGVLGCFLDADAMPFNRTSAVPAGLRETRERCVPWGELVFELKPVSSSRAEQDQPRRAQRRGGHSLPSCSLQETRPEEFFTSGSSGAFFFFF